MRIPDLAARLGALSIHSRPLAEARDLLRRAAEIGHLRDDELTELIDHLAQGIDWGSDELDLDFIDDQLRVSFHDLETWCAPEQVLGLLREVRSSLEAERP